jgi:hypothetical protein
LPAFSVTPTSDTFVALTANAAMLEFPLPCGSNPVAFAASNSMFSIAIAAADPLNVSGTPLGGATTTCCVVGAYVQLPHWNPPYTVTAADDALNATAPASVPPQT